MDLLVGHVLDPFDYNVRQRLLILQLMVAASVLTDTDATRANRRAWHSSCARCLTVLARHRWLRLLVRIRGAVGVRVIIVVDVDVVVVYYLNDFAGRAFTQLQLAEAEGVKLLLQGIA